MSEAIVRDAFPCGGLTCRTWRRGGPAFLLIQPTAAERDGEETDREAQLIAEGTDAPFLLAAFDTEDWNRDLPPWEAPAVSGTGSFGGGAEKTLAYVRETLIPELTVRYGLTDGVPMVIGGYSLAGLFALWSVWQAAGFAAAAAASPSVWFPGWIEHAAASAPHAKAVYLSLGDREERTKNRTMAAVGDNIRRMERMLRDSPETDCVLEWNEGNHFRDPGRRCAAAFLWCMQRLTEGKEKDG